ncbi:uncharacterized protein LOC125669773 isoform X2 [Ostrea edulis]|uniref:uncharacterized protein LOC125669773 isoform X2 n=1 Tax=Ostrea edulis TaxID=37623 RepID=UPI0024AEBB95|nr:uncharacterized protein LOC125669773 isoform X2 [Ostrea edulis]
MYWNEVQYLRNMPVVFRVYLIELVCIVILLGNPTESISLSQYNVTFPCGRPEDAQECRFPSQYCDTVLSSCFSCNGDICKELDSNPSCRAYCYDQTHPRFGTTTKNVGLPTIPITTTENQTGLTRTNIGLLIGLCVSVFVIIVQALVIAMLCLKKKRKQERDLIPQTGGMQLTDNDNFVSNPADTDRS